MTHEALSAFLDGECSPDELDRLLEALDRDPQLKQRYTRLCLVRESGSGARLRSANLDFADRVMSALKQEPAGRVVPFRLRRTWGWRPLAGLAAAAALAAVAVLVIRPETQPLAVPQVAQTKPLLVAPPGEVEPIAAANDREWQQLDADSSRQLDRYWIVYSQSRAQQGMGGPLGYARYTAYTAEGSPEESKR